MLAPLLAWYGVGLDLMWTGIVGGLLAYAAQRLRAEGQGGRGVVLAEQLLDPVIVPVHGERQPVGALAE